MRLVDCEVLPLRVALKRTFEGELTADTALFVAAVGVTWGSRVEIYRSRTNSPEAAGELVAIGCLPKSMLPL